MIIGSIEYMMNRQLLVRVSLFCQDAIIIKIFPKCHKWKYIFNKCIRDLKMDNLHYYGGIMLFDDIVEELYDKNVLVSHARIIYESQFDTIIFDYPWLFLH